MTKKAKIIIAAVVGAIILGVIIATTVVLVKLLRGWR
jgi:hypothetical protein